MVFLEDNLDITKLRINLKHDNCKSRFENNELNDVKMILGTSIPLKLNQYFFTIEAFYPVNSRQKVSMILRELKGNSSVHSLESWSIQNNALKISFIEKPEDSPLALIRPLGILKYNEISQQGVDNISVVLHELNIRPLVEILNLLGDVRIVRQNELNENTLDFKYLLTDKEESVLGMAVSMGYFDNPKKTHLKDIARQMNISIVATDKYLRSAERKVILQGFSY